jgi:hypothetical protein
MKDLDLLDENLRDWFKKSKSTDGKPGWVQVVSGKPCAKQPGQKTTPKCVSSAKRASMSKKERESAQRRKREADPDQPEKSGAAKPTYVATDKKKKKKSKKNEDLYMNLEQIIAEELEAVLDEKKKRKKKKKKKSGKKDACYHKVKSRYKVWPSAYASGALVKCRKVGAKNWGNSKKESLQIMIEDELTQVLLETHSKKHEKELEKISDELAGASKMHKGQSDRIKKVLDQTKDPEEDKVEEAVLLEKCWDGYKQVGMKKKGDKMVPNCVPLQEETELYEMKNCGCGQKPCVTYGEENKQMIITLDEVVGDFLEEALYYGLLDEEQELEEAKKKKACKPSKGKKFARRVKGRCVSYGQAGKAKGGGARIKPGTGKGNAYCARSYGDMKSHGKDCSGKDRGTPLCLSRQKWKCSGKYSKKGK